MSVNWFVLLVCMAVHLSGGSTAPSLTSPTLFISLPSTSFVIGELLGTIESRGQEPNFELAFGQDCPEDTFTVAQSSGELRLLRTITFSESASPQCRTNPQGDYFTSIQTFYCTVIEENSYGIPVVINVIPVLESTQLIFPEAFYRAAVVEGVVNATVSVSDNVPLATQTLPVNGLLTPQYRIIGVYADNFTVISMRSTCHMFPTILTTQELRRTEGSVLDVTLEAYVDNTHSTTTMISIEVLDINNESPQLVDPPSEVTVNENTLQGIEIEQLMAVDNDSGLNAEVRFSIATVPSPVTIHPLTGQLSIYTPLDFEQQESTEVSVVARDLGHPSLNTHTNITIFTSDANEFSPRISVQNREQLNVSESAALGTEVATFEVSDSDSSDITVTIANLQPATYFSVQQDSVNQYHVIVSSVLDFETAPNGLYGIVLTATDDEGLSTSTELEIAVLDENEVPSFAHSAYEASVRELIPPGSVIAQLAAVDPDSGMFGDLTYSLSSTSPLASLFNIHAETGSVFTTGEIDYEVLTPRTVTFQVTASNMGLSATASITVNILDENDNAPTFTESMVNISLPESHDSSNPVYLFSVEDLDSGCNGAVQFSVLHAEPSIFRIDSFSGNLYLVDGSTLDFNAFESAVVVVRATDLGDRWSFTAESTLHISVIQANTDAPVIDPITCPCLIREGLPSGQQCFPLSAHDPDSSTLEFRIQIGNMGGRFTIDPDTGIVRSTTSLDREDQSEYDLVIAVWDGSFLSEPQTLRILIVDVNDSPPVYTSATINLVSPIDVELNDYIGSVTAVHRDVGFNGLTNHQFHQSTPQSVRNALKLDPLSGRLFAAQAPLTSPLTFTVTATDILNSQQQSSVAVSITVSGLKNTPPYFATSSEQYTVASDHNQLENIAILAATDDDSDANGVLTYSLLQNSGNHSDLFAVSSSGAITSVSSLTLLGGTSYLLNVSVTDNGSPSYTANQEVIIAIYDSVLTIGQTQLVYNPSVLPCHYTGTTQELMNSDGTTGVTIPSIQEGQASTIIILDSEFSAAFEIEEDGNGQEVHLLVRGGFGSSAFEGRQAIFLTTQAVYGGNFHYCSVTIQVQDINNHAPQFTEDTYSFEVFEDTPIESSVFQVSATDQDVGLNTRPQMYRIDTQSVPFSIDSSTGAIEVAGSLDQPGYSITVAAIDDSSTPVDGITTSTATVLITVLQTTNSAPSLMTDNLQTTFNIAEDTIDRRIATLDVSDSSDRGSFAINTLCIASGNLQEVFFITPGGELSVNPNLDFETQPSTFNLEIMAYDMTSNPASATLELTVNVIDANDAVPVFTTPTYTAVIAESAPISSTVITVHAEDSDAGLNGEVQYFLQSPMFSIHLETGTITTSTTLNREASATHTLTVTATDQGSQPKSSQATVIIEVLDINDNSPVFRTPSTSVSVLEDSPIGSTVLTLEAIDDDSGANGEVAYSLIDGNENFVFNLNPWTGEVVLATEIDFESTMSYELTFEVMDLGIIPRTAASTLTIAINVQDVNDNYPVFSSRMYKCSIPEGSGGSFNPACQVSAVDDDMTGSIITYSLLNSNVPFAVASNNGVITRNGTIDREIHPQFVLRVRAQDSGNPRKSSVAVVEVSVQDEGDAIPVFDVFRSLFVPENLPFNSLLFFAHANDADLEPEFSNVTYSMVSNNEDFRLDSVTGAVFLNRELDFETEQTHSVRVIAANPSVTQVSGQYTVNILDVNENLLPPIFEQSSNPSVVSIPRDTPTDTAIATLRAVDPDPESDTSSVTYYAIGGSAYGYFKIDVSTGVVSTAFSLSAKEENTVVLEVVAIDGGSHPLSSETVLVIELLSAAHSVPYFVTPVFTADLAETIDTGHVIITVRAEVNGYYDPAVCYSISSVNNFFSINSTTGAISSDVGPGSFEEGLTYSLIVSATKPNVAGMSSALVLINLSSSNEFTPDFRGGGYDLSLIETYPVDDTRPFVRVFARDDNLGENGRLTYTLEDQSSLPFRISSTTGDMFLTSQLSLATTPSYTVTVTVRDNGIPILSRSTTFTITVVSAAADSAPIPVIQSRTVEISEAAIIDFSPLTTLTPNEPIPPQTLMYRIVENPTEFTISPNTGELYLTAPLDFDTVTMYTLTVEVWDGRAGLTTTSIQVDVTDINDNRPQFTLSTFTGTVTEHMNSGQTVTILQATDEDSDKVLTYFVVDALYPASLSQFMLMPNGMLVVDGDIDREETPMHVLTVRVEDNGGLSNYARVVINVIDTNDHNPEFILPLPDIYVAEDAANGSVVHNIVTFDPDTGNNAQNVYSREPEGVPFDILATTGEIVVTGMLDAETQTQYTMLVRATNINFGGASQTTLTINLIDLLDSAPVWPNVNTATVQENLPSHTEVASFYDSTNTHPVYYSIASGNDLGRFFIEPLTGILRTSILLDRELQPEYVLTIQGSFNNELSSDLSVRVIVGDENDNPPQFLSSFMLLNIPESTLIMVPVIDLNITDPDEGMNAEFHCKVVDSLAAQFFSVDESGHLMLLKPLNRDMFDLIVFDLFCFDSGTPVHYSRGQVQVSVVDSNNNIPQFEQSTYTFILSTPAVVDVPVFTVTATDRDLDMFGEIQYSINGGNGSAVFSIRSNTGEISVRNNFNLQSQYQLVVAAFDGGGLSSSVTVNILTKECGFRQLQFNPDIIRKEIIENLPMNSIVLRSEGSLLEFGQESSYEYSITPSVFDVDQDNGEVFVREELDRETREVHQLVVQAKDRSNSERIAQLDIEITLLDVNDNAPMFTPPPSPRYIAFVRNNETAGYEVFRVQASDRDKGLNAQLSYSLINDPSDSFAIENVTGVISLTSSIGNSPLDSIVTLTVQATDRGVTPLNSTAMIDIHIVDSNAPRFSMEVYNTSVREDINISNTVITVFASSVTPDITYRFDDDTLPFEIGRRDGVVRVRDPGLDFELRSLYSLTLVAEDSSTANLLSGRARLDITVIDVNDNPPIFGQSIYTAQEREDVDTPSDILQVSASDRDSLPNAGITYLVDGGEFGDIFSLDQAFGVVTIVGNLDYEQFPVYQFNIIAIDSGTPQQTGSATIRIGVENVNDNAPVFTQPSYTISVSESAAPGDSLGLFVVATDEDNLAQPVYSIVPDTPGYENFEVTSDGLLVLNQQSVDLSQVSYELNVSAFDGIFYGYATVLVEVQDSNDNSPMFNQTTYTASVVENGGNQVVVQVFATDADQGANAAIVYSISNSFSVFAINPESGVISTVSNIDREANPSYAFTVVARDGGGRTGIAGVFVTVEDVNDNRPAFTLSMYEGSVVEDSEEGTFVVTIDVTDNDIGESARLVYTLISTYDQFPFVINERGDITVGPVSPDSAIETCYKFTVSVRDSGNPPLTASTQANVTITVTQAADNTPQLASPTFVSVSEDTPRDTVVLELIATNTSCQMEALFFFAVTPDYFNLNEDNQITVDRTPLPVGNRSLFIRIVCFGENIERVQMVTIEVVDINNGPELQFINNITTGLARGYDSTVMENAAVDSVLNINALNMVGSTVTDVTIAAQDPDDGINGTLIFRLRDVPQNLDGTDLFIIATTSNTGIMLLNGPLDFDFGPRSYVFMVEVVDGGNPPLSDSEPILITVQDVNDIPPVFLVDIYTIQVPEDQQLNSTFFTIEAVDNDTAPENKAITYQLSGAGFEVNEAGGIFTTIELDRETTSRYELSAIASDGPHHAAVSVIIIVTDVNDEPPVFNQTLYSITLVENFPTDTVFLQVFTTDADEGDNAQASFSIIEQPAEIVMINNITGEISFIVPPDYEFSPQLELQVGAVDVGNPTLSAVVTVAITLEDVNDNSPEFSETVYLAELLENLPGGTRVTRVEAVDKDSLPNAAVSYTLDKKSEELFNINNGVITTRVPFDREMNSSLEIIVIATDSGVPSRNSSATVQVTIIDVNDERPEFESEVYSVQISEFEADNFVFLSVRAIDGDEGPNARIDYSLSGENSNEFFIQTNPDGSASLALQNELNFERISMYNLTLRAIDGGFPLMEDMAILLVEVIDENDNPPEFDQFNYEESIREDASVGSFILSVSATDRDVSDVLVYTIQNGASYPELSINSTTGALHVAATLDYEATQEYNLIIIAADQTDNPMSASAEVTITLIDVNDNAPHFLPHNSTQSIVENGDPTVLLTLEANDIDSASLPGQITFSIASGNVGDVFEIGSVSGRLEVTEPLDRESVASYLLTISATDNGSPSLTGFTNITVIVEDLNDNQPTGGHQDIYLYLLNGRAPIVSLGRVFVNDSDIVNEHIYTVVDNPTESSLRILGDGTIEINSENPASSTITVQIQDGSAGTAITTISSVIRNISSESLVNSFSMQIVGSSPQNFVDNILGRFLAVATSVLKNALDGEIDFQVFSIEGSTSLPSNLDLFILVEDTVNRTFIHPNLVQHILHVNRRTIEQELSIMIQTESVDLCSSESCNGGELCSNNFEYSSTDSISFGSRSITYLGLAAEHSMVCEQPQRPPCEALTSCREPALCIESIENSIAVCQDSCTPNPCKNGGTCQPQSPGYYCICPSGFDGRNCELTGATFDGSSYAILPSISRQLSGTISLEVATSQNNGLLLYIGRFDDEYNDFIALELDGGLPSVLVSYGSNQAIRTPQLQNTRTLSDLLWHQLTIDYTEISVTLTLTTYNPFIVDRSTVSISGDFRYLDLGGPLIFGSLPESFGYGEVAFQPFTGCVRNVRINNKLIDFSETLAQVNLMIGCRFADAQCDNNPCNNDGSCVGIWGSYYCDCTSSFMGTTCSQDSQTASFSGLNFIQYKIQTNIAVRPLRQASATESPYTTGQNDIQLSLITSQTSGIVLQLGDVTNSQEYLVLEVVSGLLQVRYNLGSGEAVLLLSSIQVNDEQFHSVVITRTEREMDIVVDGRYFNRITSPGSESTLDIPASAMYLGASVHPNGSAFNGFLGCVTGLTLDRREVPVGGENGGFVTLVISDSISEGCPFGSLFEEPRSDVQVYAIIAAILVMLLLISASFVGICMISRWVRRRRTGEHTVNLRRNSTRRSWNFREGSPTQEGFRWQPTTMYKHNMMSPQGAYRSTPQHAPEPAFNFNMNNKNLSPVHSVPPAVVAETAFNDRRSSSMRDPQRLRISQQQETAFNNRRSSSMRAQQRMGVSQPQEGFAFSQSNQGYRDDIDLGISDTESGHPQHIRSLSGQQSILSASTIATSSNMQEDTEVSKYLGKRLDMAHSEIVEQNYDEMHHYKVEGPFQPMGSIGSLLDFVKELDPEYKKRVKRNKKEMYQFPTESPATTINPRSEPQPLQVRTAASDLQKSSKKTSPLTGQKFEEGSDDKPELRPNPLPANQRKSKTRKVVRRDSHSKRMENILERFHNITTGHKPDEGRLI